MVIPSIRNSLICPYCGQLTEIIWVHGHGQCMYCKTNFDECCRGECVDDNDTEQKKDELATKDVNKEK